MKRLLSVITPLLLFLTFCSKTSPTFPWSNGSYAETLSIAGSRIVQLEFYTDT